MFSVFIHETVGAPDHSLLRALPVERLLQKLNAYIPAEVFLEVLSEQKLIIQP